MRHRNLERRRMRAAAHRSAAWEADVRAALRWVDAMRALRRAALVAALLLTGGAAAALAGLIGRYAAIGW